MSELSRVEDLLKTGVEEPVLPMSRLEAILRGEKITPQSRVEELLLQYNPSDILIEKRITENGTYFAVNDNADGYFKVVVDTPVVPPTVLDHLIETITSNGLHEYTPTHDGFDTAAITVAVPIPPEKILGTKTITENDTYDASDDSKEVTESFTPPSIGSDSYVHIDLAHISDATEVDISAKYYLSGGDPVECNIDISDIPTFTPTSVSDRSSMYNFYQYNSSNRCYISKDATGIWILSKNASGATFIFSNTAYKYEAALDGYSQVTVNVPTPTPVLDDITITENGTYTSEHDGFDEVTVNVSGGGTLDPNYNYYKAANDTIVVRVYHEGESDENIKWFFCGYSKEATDADVPSNLLEYVPTLSTSITSRAMSPTKDESSYDYWIGWSSSIGNLKIRSWNSSWGATAAGTFWAVIDTSNGDEQMNVYEDPYVYQPESDSYVFLKDGKVPSNQGTTYLTPDKAFTTNTWYNLAVVANNKTFIFATYWEGNNGAEYSFKPDTSTTYYISIYYDGTVKVRCASGSWYAMDVCVTKIRNDYIPS